MATINTLDAPSAGGPLGLLRTVSRPSLLAFGVAILAIVSGSMTYAVLSGGVAYGPASPVLLVLLLVNFALVLSLGALIAWRLTQLWAERRSGQAGARLHVRLVTMFSAIAVIPAIFVAVFAIVTLNLGIEQWFAPQLRSAIFNSTEVARRYMTEHGQSIETDARTIATAVQQDPRLIDQNRQVHTDFLFAQIADMAQDRGLQAAYVFDSGGNVLGSTKPRNFSGVKPPTSTELTQAADGTIVIDADGTSGTLHALVRLQALANAYLFVVRKVDPHVLGYYKRVAAASNEYRRLSESRARKPSSYSPNSTAWFRC